jgi:uncharacterized protein YgiM (DUF1202 family)
MKVPILAILAAILASLACTQVVSPPSVSGMFTAAAATPAPSATPTPEPTQTSVPAAVSQTAIVRAAFVNVRAEPNGEVVGQIEAGTNVQIVECRDDWCQIVEPAGWVFQGCLSIAGDLRCEAK